MLVGPKADVADGVDADATLGLLLLDTWLYVDEGGRIGVLDKTVGDATTAGGLFDVVEVADV